MNIKHSYLCFGVGPVGFLWVPPWCWRGTPRQWIFSTAHDSSSWFWRVLGWEINWERE